MIEIKNLSLNRGNKTLLQDASLLIKPQSRVGLIGENGTGKSSLFALLKGQLHADQGDISIPKEWRIASVSQETPALEQSALDYVLDGDAKLRCLQAALIEAETKDDGEEIAHLHDALTQIEAYSAPARAAKLLSGLGFEQEEHSQSVKSFSGGWRMRLNLAQALMCPADLLLLDEPTNHLDLETVLWLEEHLQTLESTQIIISHDKDFLDALATHIVELHGQKLTLYTGNYDKFEQMRALKFSQQQSAYQKQQQHIKHLQSFIDRFKAKATKAAQAQSRVKALERLERVAPAHMDSAFSFGFETPTHLPNPLVKLENITLGYEQKNILEDISFSLESGARFGLLGVNGSGKSTFIKALCGELTPLAGEIIRADKLNIGYFAQHQLENLRSDQSPIWHIQQLSPTVREQEIRNFLGGFNFIGEMALQNIAPFSGGEKARLALAMIVWQKPNLLLLDEPTNHLDLNLRHALTLALQSFNGALILVSHDRSLLEATTDSFLLIHNKKLEIFDGDLNSYRQWRLAQQSNKASPETKDNNSRKEDKRKEAQKRQQLASKSKPLLIQTSKIEREIEQLNIKKNEIESFLNQEDAYSDENKIKLQAFLSELNVIKSTLDREEEKWLELQDQLETIKSEIDTAFDTTTN